jgi:plastocyanin
MIELRPRITSLGALAAAAALLAGCGSSSPATAGGGGTGSSASAPPSSGKGYGYGTGGTPAAAKTPAAPSGAALRTSADPAGGLAFTKKHLTAKAGKVTLVMDNPGSAGMPHGIAIEGHGVDKDGQTVGPGGVSKVSVSLKPGTYTFYCPVPGHRQGGMTGTLTVR